MVICISFVGKKDNQTSFFRLNLNQKTCYSMKKMLLKNRGRKNEYVEKQKLQQAEIISDSESESEFIKTETESDISWTLALFHHLPYNIFFCL